MVPVPWSQEPLPLSLGATAWPSQACQSNACTEVPPGGQVLVPAGSPWISTPFFWCWAEWAALVEDAFPQWLD